MSSSRWLLAALVCVVLSAAPRVEASDDATPYDLAVGLSPFLHADDRVPVRDALLEAILQEVPLQSRITVYDAYRNRLITEIDIPDRAALSRFKVRANFFAKELRAIAQFLESSGHDGAELAGSAAVRLPQFLDFVAETTPRSERPTVIVTIGSPLYVDEPFSMLDGLVPSDGYLAAGQDRSPFGCRTRRGFLNDKRLHIAWTGAPFESAEHEFAVKRLWSLYASQQGGALLTFASDVVSVFRRASDLESEPIHRFALRDSSSLSMVRVTDPPPLTTDGRSVAGRNAVLKLTAMSDCRDCDLDLYVRAPKLGEELSYLNPRSRLGIHYKSYERARRGARGDEVVEVFEPVPLDQLEVWVGFYEGNAPAGVTGTLLVERMGQTHRASFHIPATSGNLGDDRAVRALSPHWAKVDLANLARVAENAEQP